MYMGTFVGAMAAYRGTADDPSQCLTSLPVPPHMQEGEPTILCLDYPSLDVWKYINTSLNVLVLSIHTLHVIGFKGLCRIRKKILCAFRKSATWVYRTCVVVLQLSPISL